MPPPELTINHFDASAVPAIRDELLAVYADARADVIDQPFYTPARYGQRLDGYLTGPGFDLVAGALDAGMVGFAFGSRLTVDTRWWQGMEAASDIDLSRETGKRTFAFRELNVRRAYQRHGYGRALHDALLAHRPEERATLLVRSDNPARPLYDDWGWTLVGYTQPYPDSPRFAAMTLPLNSAHLTPRQAEQTGIHLPASPKLPLGRVVE